MAAPRGLCEGGLAVLGKLRHLLHHAEAQAARLLIAQHGVAWQGEGMGEGPQKLASLGVVEGQALVLIVQESAHTLGHLHHKHIGLDSGVEQLKPTTVRGGYKIN